MLQALSDCLAAESKSVEAKLQVLTAALSYYTELRPTFDSTSAEADTLAQYLFMSVLSYPLILFIFGWLYCSYLEIQEHDVC